MKKLDSGMQNRDELQGGEYLVVMQLAPQHSAGAKKVIAPKNVLVALAEA